MMSELPSIQQLKNFITYGKYQNFTSAARAANITQSAFSFQMKRLEELVGIQLIERSNRGSHLTKDGELFYERISPLVSELETCLCDIRALSGDIETLSVGTMLSLGDVQMNRHLAYFQKHHHSAALRVYNMEAREMLQWLSEDKLDIISLFELPPLDISAYEKAFFCNEDLVYYAPHLDGLEEPITADTIASNPLAQYSPQYVMHDYIDHYFSVYSSVRPKTQAWFSTPYAIMNYCQQNRMGSLLPKRFLHAMGVERGYYDLIPPITLPCYLLYKKTNPNYNAIQLFVSYIQETYHVYDAHDKQ
ncbi:LysR family transcriptional regulator [Megasphaera hutchinsoni]|uniref:Transcriptional regulator, LysR family n=1 Tax=Megasphaera hutchinsoni TaxID=1588748 RepID=A0A134CF67_9FIRM|nr:LysR family transcriptional regulator [Megasphaera hutchinsoni]KXB90830.1 transcriptional regulator, LysR family [Megasphaera hutchinsoni]